MRAMWIVAAAAATGKRRSVCAVVIPRVVAMRNNAHMTLALEELWYRKGQFALIGLIVTLITYLVLMMNALGSGLLDQAGSAVKRLDADALVFREDTNLSIQQSELGAATVAAIEAAEGVDASARLGYLSVQPTGEEAAAFLGFEPGTIAEPKLRSGRAIEPGERGVVLADKRYLETRGAKVGDRITLFSRLQAIEFEIVGSVDEGSFFFQPPLWGSIDDWQQLRYGANEDVPVATLVMVQGESGIENTLPERVEGIEAATTGKTFSSIPGVGPQQTTANAIQGFALVIGALVVGIFFYVLTLQKVGQIGVLKAIGASSWFVFRQLLTQVMLISIIGLIIAVPLAVFTVGLLPGGVPLLLERDGTILTVVLLLITAVVGVAFSGRKIAQVDPLIALGQQQ